jgi:two-component sensor histidine kinase/GNAT superfamily N-acetyltransferase
LVLAREEERRRIRRDLHDGLGPALASQTFALDTALDLLESDPQAAADLLQGLKKQNQGLVADIRRLVYELRPPTLDELGLAAALAAHIQQLNGQHGTEIRVEVEEEAVSSLAAAVEVAIYRLVQEGVNNVLRHAEASRCTVTIRPGREMLTVTIADNGRGMPEKVQPGVGMVSMRERAEELGGTFTITAREPRGTVITASFPTGGPFQRIIPARPEDLPVVMEIIGEAADWVAEKGIDQWPSPPSKHWWRRMGVYVERGEIFLAYQDGAAVGTLRLTWSDPYWPEDGQAGYVHRLALRDEAHGRNLGRALLQWATDQVRQRERALLRLDVPAANARLRRYYETEGFIYRGDVTDHDYVGALYEKEV